MAGSTRSVGGTFARLLSVSAACMPLSHRPCHFEDSDHRCWQPWTGRGVCAAPAAGASALVQHADQRKLCKYNPPHGFRALCRGPAANATLRMLRALRDPAVCRYRSCAVVGSGGGPCENNRPEASANSPSSTDLRVASSLGQLAGILAGHFCPHRRQPARCSVRRRNRRARRRDRTQP